MNNRKLIQRLRSGGDLSSCIEAADALEAMEWKSMSLAPTNNVRVLLYIPPFGPSTGNYADGSWLYSSVLDATAQPTDWMPLPKPPEVVK